MERELSLPDAIDALKKEGLDDNTIIAFMRFFNGHERVWDLFERYALRAVQARRPIGGKAIMERVRYEVEVEDGDPFAVNNNYTSYFCRIFEAKWPEYRGFFEKRKIRGLAKV